MTSCLLRYQLDGARGAGGIELFTVIALTVIACLAVDNVNVLETISKNSSPLPGIIAAVLHKNAVSLREREALTDTESVLNTELSPLKKLMLNHFKSINFQPYLRPISRGRN